MQEGSYGVKEGDDAADHWKVEFKKHTTKNWFNCILKRDWADKMDAHFDVREYAQLAKEYARLLNAALA